MFNSPTMGVLDVGGLISEISDFVREDPGSYYRLVIGTDSQTKSTGGKPQIDFVTAVVVHRKGKGARYFWKKEKKDKIPVLRDKIYTETLLSLSCAQE